MERLVIILNLAFILCSASIADTIYVSDYGTNDGVTQADVEAAIAAASVGDTVQLSAGSATWATDLQLAKGVHLKGAGIGSTTITGGQGTGSVPNTDQWNVLDVDGSANRVTISDISFDGNRTSNGIHASAGAGYEILIYNCSFLEFRGSAISSYGEGSQLIHSCTFTDNYKTTDVYVGTASMDNSWQTALTLGGSALVVREDNTFTYTNGGWYPAAAAATCSHGLGGRAVFRYNTWVNNGGLDFFPIIDVHGNQTTVSGQTPDTEIPGGTGTHRGTRQVEIYGNTFTQNGLSGSSVRKVHFRGGTILYYDNTYTDTGAGTIDGSIYCQEEDSPSRWSYKLDYPGYDMHRLWFWNNLQDAVEVTTLSYADGTYDPPYIVIGTNAYNRAPQSGDIIDISSYAALPYPHPWRAQTRSRTPAKARRNVLIR